METSSQPKMTRNNLQVTAQSRNDLISKNKQQNDKKLKKKSSNFIKDQIFQEPVANYECNLQSLKIFQMSLYKKLHEKSCCYLVIIYMKKASLKGKANKILTACALVVICIHVSALDSCYMTNALGFSQSEARKFFVYIFSIGNNMISSAIWCQQAQVNFSKTTNCIPVTTLHSHYMKNGLVFSKSDVRYFFRYIITRRQRVRFRIKLPTNKHRPDKKQKERQMRGL